MPNPHFDITITQRSKGQSAVAGAAYQSGEKLFSEYDQKTKNYTGKRGINASRQSVPKFVTCRLQGRLFCYRENPGEMEAYMAFFSSAIDTLQTLVIALGAGLGVWGVVNLLEGYGSDNPGSNAHIR